jgi:hypothetical protein
MDGQKCDVCDHIWVHDDDACPECGSIAFEGVDLPDDLTETNFGNMTKGVEAMTNREAHEEAAGMGLEPAFFEFNKIDPNAEYVENKEDRSVEETKKSDD